MPHAKVDGGVPAGGNYRYHGAQFTRLNAVARTQIQIQHTDRARGQ